MDNSILSLSVVTLVISNPSIESKVTIISPLDSSTLSHLFSPIFFKILSLLIEKNPTDPF